MENETKNTCSTCIWYSKKSTCKINGKKVLSDHSCTDHGHDTHDVKDVVVVGNKTGKSAYESLKDARYIKSPTEFL